MRPATALGILSASLCSLLAQAPARQMQGRVIGPLGEPVAGAAVWTEPAPGTGRPRRTQTDGEGLFVLSGKVAIGGQYVYATKAGLTISKVFFGTDTQLGRRSPTLYLFEAITIAGRVTDDNGHPVPGATVVASKSFPWLRSIMVAAQTTTDAAGKFELAGVALGNSWLRVFAAGFDCSERALHAVEDTTEAITMVAGSGNSITITVTGLAAELPAGPMFELAGRQARGVVDLPVDWRRRTVDATHVVEWRGLPTAAWTLSMPLDTFRFEPPYLQFDQEPAAQQLTVHATAVVPTLLRGTLRYGNTRQENTAAGAGRAARVGHVWIVDPGGAHLARAPVDNGQFAVRRTMHRAPQFGIHLDSDTWVVVDRTSQATLPSGLQALFGRSGSDNTEQLDLVVTAAAQVHGRVLDQDGQPVPFMTVSLLGLHEHWQTVRQTASDLNGRFRFGRLLPVQAPVRLRCGNQDAEPFRLEAGKAVARDLRIEPAMSVIGQASHPNGKPLAGAVVTCFIGTSFPGNRRIDILTNREGHYAFVDVRAPGQELHLRITEPGFAGRTDGLPFAAGVKTVNLQATLR